ncbi:NADP-dependent oxidoreductase domain protein [Gemmatirosa kalamazoonensis]|uniref:NADP-dependent oxidoreductase domain protein n=1 Tax=Gemmatirosa kalamazoonensis TaxID=861299 RepID=W0RA99_9BACT|nr:aldo/keto reductase [Gemmatirosa kalamazoonensis]AHG88044.1 NADP-dependent oxidoreductase domain protein [Gemmatirosa kalamazoonensis]
MSPGTRSTRPAATATAPSQEARRATREGTARYVARFASRFTEDYFRAMGARGSALAVGSIGLGTYLGECSDDDDARYETAVYAGLAAGCNVVDTAINYRCQRSERAVGRAVARALADGVARRDEVVVCTKGGYIALDGAPPATREAYEAYLADEFFGPGVMRPEDVVHGGHSFAPGFLAHQIARSRANLGVDTIDLYYLHEPERQLDSSAGTAFATTLRRAIEALEASVARGEIARWGIATWRGLRVPPGAKARDHLALADVVAAARDVAGDAHHFAAVQLPISLAMPEAVRAPTQPLATRGASPQRTVPLLQAAQELGVAVVASAPLMQAQLASNLPPALRDAFPGCETDAQRAITFVRSLPGVAVALVGTRSVEHLTENLRSAR